MNTQVRINSVNSSLLKARFTRRKSNNRDRSMIKADSCHWPKRLSRFGFLLALHHPLSLGDPLTSRWNPDIAMGARTTTLPLRACHTPGWLNGNDIISRTHHQLRRQNGLVVDQVLLVDKNREKKQSSKQNKTPSVISTSMQETSRGVITHIEGIQIQKLS